MCCSPWVAKSQTRLSDGTTSMMKVLAVQSCPTLCDPMDCSPPGSSVHGISRARILEWVALYSCVFTLATHWIHTCGKLLETISAADESIRNSRHWVQMLENLKSPLQVIFQAWPGLRNTVAVMLQSGIFQAEEEEWVKLAHTGGQ